MNQPICLITGATDGIGKQTALGLAKKGFKLVIAGRNKNKAEAAKKEIEAVTNGDTVDYILADFTSLTQIHQLAQTFKSRYSKLDVLINNLGIFSRERKLTQDGYDVSYQVNYLSQFFLTNLLAATSVYLASSENVKGISGKYFSHSKIVTTKNKFNTKENRELLWDISMKSLQRSEKKFRST